MSLHQYLPQTAKWAKVVFYFSRNLFIIMKYKPLLSPLFKMTTEGKYTEYP